MENGTVGCTPAKNKKTYGNLPANRGKRQKDETGKASNKRTYFCFIDTSLRCSKKDPHTFLFFCFEKQRIANFFHPGEALIGENEGGLTPGGDNCASLFPRFRQLCSDCSSCSIRPTTSGRLLAISPTAVLSSPASTYRNAISPSLIPTDPMR